MKTLFAALLSAMLATPVYASVNTDELQARNGTHGGGNGNGRPGNGGGRR